MIELKYRKNEEKIWTIFCCPKECKSCSLVKSFPDEYLFGKIGVDTTENEPRKVCANLAQCACTAQVNLRRGKKNTTQVHSGRHNK